MPLLVATFAGGVANLVAIVGFMVVATSGLPDHEQGLATGLTSMSQQVGITLGIPVMSAVATARADLLDGLALAIAAVAAVCVAAALLVLAGTQAAQGELDDRVGELVGERAVGEPAVLQRSPDEVDRDVEVGSAGSSSPLRVLVRRAFLRS